MSIQSAKIDAGQVRLPQRAPWRERFIAEAASFLNRKYDDQIDSMSQALYAFDCRPGELRHCTRFKG